MTFLRMFVVLLMASVATADPDVGFTLEVDCEDQSIYLVVTSTETVDLIGFQVPLEWPEGMAPESENLADGDGDGVPDGSIVGFVGPPGQSLDDGDAIWAWTMELPDGEPLTVGPAGVEVARFEFDTLPDFIDVVATGLGGIPAKALEYGDSTFTNLWDEVTDSWSFECWASAPNPQGPGD